MSSEQTQLTLRENQAVVPAEPTNLLAAIISLSRDPNFDVEKLERLCAMQERLEKREAEKSFNAALARLQAKIPQIVKDGRIIVEGRTRSTFAKLEDIDVVVRPMLAEEGFAFTTTEVSVDGHNRRYEGKLSHRDGHSEPKYCTLPLDTSGSKQGPQAAGSTEAYAHRYLLKKHLNIVERGQDNDGMGSDQAISDDQAVSLLSLMDEVKADKVRFLKHMGVEAVADILQRDYKRAVELLEQKRRATQK